MALVAGTLGQGGAEKQLVYMVRALLDRGVQVRVYSLTRGEYHEAALKGMGTPVHWVGRPANPASRLVGLMIALREFRPHILQSAHFYTNLYAGLAAPLAGAISLGAIRSDLTRELASHPRLGRLLLARVDGFVANSEQALRNARESGIGTERMHVLPNVIDLEAFDRQLDLATEGTPRSDPAEPVAVAVGRLVRVKRLDRFIEALALAQQQVPALSGIIVGDGPERDRLQAHSRERGLFGERLTFLGRRDDIPTLLSQAHMLVLTSDNEGFPNVLLEAMAASLPVLATPAGDCGLVVVDGVTGFVLAFDDTAGLAQRMVDLARCDSLRRALGSAARLRVEQHYGADGLAERLLAIYRHVATRSGSRRVVEALAAT